ncbi:MAG: redox-regulated ATPase YchF [Bacilli bacterium]|nr:redox-regulated ATPase YchF [Bacilli bacterium]MDD4734070.1 redox-regulated ATPase YchF [Bacilli bacterium]
MGLKAGIVGLPNVGKSTLFNAITKKNILAANYPFATIDPNIGMVVVPDKRLEYLEQLYIPEKMIPTAFEFIDIAGLVKGASTGEGLGNKFLSHIREVDAICEVVRCFKDDNIIHVENSVDPIRDIEIINIELVLADLEVVETRMGRIGKKATMAKDKETIKENELLLKIKACLEQNKTLRSLDFNEEEKSIIKPFNFLTLKPIIYMANISENDLLDGNNEYVDMVIEYAKREKNKVITVCAKMESEIVELNEEDKIKFLNEVGIEESGLDKLISATYELLGLETYFTVGKDEVRAWTYTKGMKAPECAGIIHSDFERGFIRAEIMSFEDLKHSGDEKKVREAGKMRLEGKEYIMKDGDICHFRFNV